MVPLSIVNPTLLKLLLGYQANKTCRYIGFASSENVNTAFRKQSSNKGDEKRNNCDVTDEQVKNPLHTLHAMEEQDISIDCNVYGHLLHKCAQMNTLIQGKIIHGHSVKKGTQATVFMRNHLVNMYAKCGEIENARRVFDKMPLRNVYSWNTMIAGYVKCGRVDLARDLFDEMPQRDVVAWNTIIAGFAQRGQGEEALRLFCEMRHECIDPDHFSCSSVISASAGLTVIQQGKQVHSYVVQAGFASHVTVNNALVTMYVKYENMENARQVFDNMPERDDVSWNAVITGYAQHGRGVETLELFEQMVGEGLKPNQFTMASVLSAYANLEALDEGKQFHAHIILTGFETNTIVGSALVDMYAKCGNIDCARQVFDILPERDLVVWNAMVAGYSQQDYCEEALELFAHMQQERMIPDECSFVCALSACAGLAASEQGKQIHALVMRTEFKYFVSVSNALVTMYAKCGSIEDARHLFDKMPQRDVVSCNAMIAGYAQHGCGKEALWVFEQMLAAGIKPTHVTFIAVFSACSHAGLVGEGRRYFQSMSRDHFIKPSKDHYTCMIDLLGRSGHVEEAENFIKNMPFEPDAIGWAALLGACRSHGNIELGSRAADCLLKLEPENATVYVALSNMYAAAGRWDDVARVRKLMKDKGVKKKPGCSWIEINKKVHAFVAEDSNERDLRDFGKISCADEGGRECA